MTTTEPLTCRWNTNTGPCGKPAQLFPCGRRCRDHSPWGLAGQPEPLTPRQIEQRKEQQ